MPALSWIGRCLTKIFGQFDVHWNAPHWLGASWDKICAHPRVSGTVIWLLLLSGGFWWWSATRPEVIPPNLITLKVAAPRIAKVVTVQGKKKLDPPPLIIRFSESAAPLEMTGTNAPELTDGVRLEPEFAGKWKWISDRALQFKPNADWLPDQTYEIRIEPNALLVDTVVLHDTSPIFETPKFTAEISSAKFYQNPKTPDVKQAVVDLKFSHGVSEIELKRRLKFQVLGDAPIFASPERLEEIVFTDFNRRAFVRSKPITLPEKEDFIKITIGKGVSVERGSSKTPELLETKVRVPDIFSYFRISSVNVGTRRTEKGEPEPVLTIDATGLTTPKDLNENLTAFLLPRFEEPKNWPSNVPKPKAWTVDTVTDAVLARAEVVELLPDKLIDENLPKADRQTHFKRFTYTFGRFDETRQLLVHLEKDTPALGGFRLKDDYRVLRNIPEAPKELHVLGRFGGILALSGDRKITVKSRNLRALKYRIGRVPAGQLNHLVSQTRGNFRSPAFSNWIFSENNFAHFTEKTQPVFLKNSYEANYSTLNLNSLLTSGDPNDPDANRGLYLIRFYGWDPKENKAVKSGGNHLDQAFVLMTDLGIVAKLNHDETRDVFVQSIGTGAPVADAEVQILGLNGITVQSAQTGPQGRAKIPALDADAPPEKRAIAILVRNGNDLSFMPLNRWEHHVSFSRFDTGGLTAPTPGDLDGFVFTERGIYRPGETIHSGFIIKPRDWEGQLAGVPIKVRVEDARNSTVVEKIITLPESGFAEFDCPTQDASPTGEYKVWVYLVHEEDENGKRQRDTLLASTTARVEEFLPDTMKVSAKVTPESGKGWVAPDKLTASVDVQNLYGTPATERKVTGSVTAMPISFSFDQYPNFVFFDRNLKNARYHTWSAGEAKTGDTGLATFDLDLKKIAGATYSLRFDTQAFEPDSGRGVKGFSNRVLVSPLPYAVGYKPEGQLNYIPANSEKLVHLLAVNPKLERIAVEKLSYEVRESYFVSILKKQRNGDYAYESVKKERVTESGTLTLPIDSDHILSLPTATPGEFSVALTNTEKQLVAKFGYSVVGKGNRSRSLDDNAELFVTLAKPEWRRGEEIEMSITAPFTGTGLITIERDQVYAHKFFTTETNSTVQTIRVPEELEGTAYVNVTFTRALDSPEIFMSPLSYAVKPFRIANDRRKLTLELNPPKEARPGKPLRIPFRADRKCKVAIFAVDEGILQVTRYQLPKPLPHFQRKRALLVDTYQIMDLLMPEFRHIQEQLSAFGGGADFHLNPFKRINDDSVVYWSGIIDAGPDEREVTYDVPDYFDGSLKIMAVAVSRDGMGQTEEQTTVVSPILIKPHVLTFAAPGDTFDISVTLGNNLEKDANVALKIESTENLEIVELPSPNHQIAKGRETTVTFKAKAKGPLGNAEFTFFASTDDEISKRRASLSIRPPVPYATLVSSGYTEESNLAIKVDRPLHEPFHAANATVSSLPLSLTQGLDEYLAKYPHGCTEQLVSGAFSRLLLSDESDFGLTKAEVQDQINATCRMLRGRANSNGGFGMWYARDFTGVDFLTIYATHFLTEAKKSGFNVPPTLLKSAIGNLQRMAGQTEIEIDQHSDQAYAIYVLTLNDVVTTNYVLNLRDYLGKQLKDDDSWKADLTAIYLAATYQLLKKDTEAEHLLTGYIRAAKRPEPKDDFHRPLAQDAQYLSILAHHFPDKAKTLSGDDLQELLDPVVKNEFSTLGAAYSVLALKGYSRLLDEFPIELTMSERVGEQNSPLAATGTKLKSAKFSLLANEIQFTSEATTDGPSGMFYQVTEGGFGLELPTEVIRKGLEVSREFLDKDGNPITEAAPTCFERVIV